MKIAFKTAKGVTLIELIISMGLGIIITASSLQVFLSIKQVYMTQQALARIQENARIANEIIGDAVSKGGNIGCNAFKEDMSFHIPPDIDAQFFGIHPHQPIVGVTQDYLKNKLRLDNRILKRIIPSSDILWIKSIHKNYPLLKGTLGMEGYVLLQGSPKLKGGEIITISDCSHVDFFKAVENSEVKSQAMSKISLPQGFHLSKYFGEGSQVGILASTIYYIGDTGRVNANGKAIYALYSTDLNGRTIELIEGAEFLNVLYGMKNDKTIFYVKRDKVKNWKDVVKVRVNILLNSIEDGLIQPKKYDINESQVMPTDRLMRMWWSFEWSIKGLIT